MLLTTPAHRYLHLAGGDLDFGAGVSQLESKTIDSYCLNHVAHLYSQLYACAGLIPDLTFANFVVTTGIKRSTISRTLRDFRM